MKRLETFAIVIVDRNRKITDVNDFMYQPFSDHRYNHFLNESVEVDHEEDELCLVNISGERYLVKRKDTNGQELFYILAVMSRVAKLTSNTNHKKHSSDELNHIIGTSRAMNRIKDLATKVATSDSTVLLTGESGTGKELFARGIHNNSARNKHPFVAVNCVAIPDELFESEMFGYEAGAFSGARRDGKPGKVELAQNGTLFLDEISELSYASQGKLLRVLQEREVDRLGGVRSKTVNIRVVAATNKNLKQLVTEGKFREDLYYRLYVFDLNVPPLRERERDVLILIEHYIHEFNQSLGKQVTEVSEDLKAWALSYTWPGNVRELKSSIERGMNIVEGSHLAQEDLGRYDNVHLDHTAQKEPFHGTLEQAMNHYEKAIIEKAILEVEGDRTKAAALLDIHLSSLYRKLSKHQI
ncbi:sigma-54 interaction domain-containing protein [Geomicrobium sediminis]|uniref:Transcriptional regulator with PAS, ATPase and Fis domain n=1 Tax=Geomicrobium sediminis TaxID=1347788 RepID=A0ABS2PDC9_9BACL|nr:sigma 54-interacting transcriptional regulator [Geomicrobium sediminis]MBM7633429.1 transcriptional regulator with PAS, ATPase and Fis domain [Geomicrobium sediminis]